jgi:hypothetical protein
VDKLTDAVLAKVNKLLGTYGHVDAVPVFINRDPRGYALKVSSETVKAFNLDLPTDWGGYGIIAPDLSESS